MIAVLSKGISPIMEGPTIYENWKAALEGEPVKSTLEYPIFTDAHIVGGVIDEYGPYQLINTIGSSQRNARQPRPAIVLRVDIHLNFDPAEIRMDKTDDQRYHGGYLQDEIAALISLSMGIRLKAGGIIRRFSPGADPKGYPSYWDFRGDPVLPTGVHSTIVPRAIGTHHIQDAKPLLNLPVMRPEDAIPLIRAARLYQDGLWIAESEPELSWLMFVSAIETAASRWRTVKETPLERLRTSRPRLEEILNNYGGDQLVLQVADEIAPYMGSTKKFIDFILQFLPAPPAIRPNEWAQHPWDAKGMKETLRKVYAYRSRALHGGTPFPAPMSMSPDPLGDEGILTEIPAGLASSTKGGVWLAEDTPILLHTFEYIARNALLKWWESNTSCQNQAT